MNFEEIIREFLKNPEIREPISNIGTAKIYELP